MPLTLDRCGNLGGDVEMAAVVGTLARRNPDVDFYLLGRNSGEDPLSAGLPSNVYNPWTEWAAEVRKEKKRRGLTTSNLSVSDHLALQDMYDQITLPAFREMDHIIMWAGQHGTTNSPLPTIKDPDKLTKPHDWSAHYVSFIVRGINAWRDADPWTREEVWLNADPRNYLKLRDLKWPLRHPVLAQYTYSNNIKHARYGDGRDFEWWSGHDHAALTDPSHVDLVWESTAQNVYSRLEVNGMLPGTPFGDLISYRDDWEDRGAFGLFINEARRYVSTDTARRNILRDWVLPLRPAWIHGTWSADSLAEIGYSGPQITPAPWEDYYPRLHSVRSTFTTPSSGSGWATAKPWEAFAAGTVCFFHPLYDTQDNVLADAPDGLGAWLRVKSPEELAQRVRHLDSVSGRGDWEWLVRAQRRHFDAALSELRYARIIEHRLGLRETV